MPGKILVIDDEENIVQTIRYNLIREGYSVSTGTDGRQCLAIFQEESFDLVILDLMLPGMSGLDVYRHLKLRSTVPVLILSALEEHIARVAGFDLKIDYYMTKPFSLRELIIRIRQILARSGKPG